MSLLDALIYGVRDVLSNLTAQNRRSRLNFSTDFVVTEDDANDCLTVSAGGSGARAAVAISAYEIDWTLGNMFTKTLGAGARTFTFTGAISGQSILVKVTGAASTLAWPTHKKAGGVALVQTASGTDWYTVAYDGTDYTIAQGPVNIS